MTEVSISKQINVPAEMAWAKLSEFVGIEDFSPIVKSSMEGEGPGAIRTCHMPDGAVFTEELEILDGSRRILEYTILTSPLPVSDYHSRVQIEDVDEEKCQFTWSAKFNVSEESKPDMVAMFKGFYSTAIDGLESLLSVKA